MSEQIRSTAAPEAPHQMFRLVDAQKLSDSSNSGDTCGCGGGSCGCGGHGHHHHHEDVVGALEDMDPEPAA